MGLIILRYAVPTILSLLIQTLYNIADQIFIGWDMGFRGNAAVNVVYPVMTFAAAVSALIGDGGAVCISLNLGREEQDRASDAAAASLLLALGSGMAMLTVGQLFAELLLEFLGTTDGIRGDALTYLRIILMGMPPVIVSSVLASLIRADGSPRYAMLCVIPGCLLNVFLDWLFIFPLGWGIAGAAWATVLGQMVNFCIASAYLPRFRMVALFRKGKRQLLGAAAGAVRLGSAGFVNQFAAVAYVIFVNRYLERYGAGSAYGTAIPIAVFGIMMKVSQISTCFLSGVAVGMQPVLGYHYGKQDFLRVKVCLKTAALLATVFGTAFFLIYELLPEYIMLLFGETDALYVEYGVHCFRIFLLAIPIYGFSIVSTGLFQAIGKPVHAMFMALSRQIIYFIPLAMYLAPRYGVVGMLWASPIGDIFAFATCLTLFLREWKQLSINCNEAGGVCVCGNEKKRSL